jgi:anti-sigma factor ChrR (cupin superfamily)
MEGASIHVQEEMLLAKQSRAEGNEGRARVCARRAAGTAAGQYLLGRGVGSTQDNAVQSLLALAGLDSLPERVQIAAGWLVERVDESSNLPPEVDLIQEAAIVIRFVESSSDS